MYFIANWKMFGGLSTLNSLNKVIKFLKIFTDLEIGEIDRLQNNNINELKVLLANKATAMLHGKKAAENSEQAAKEAFSGNSLGANLPSVKIKLKELLSKVNKSEEKRGMGYLFIQCR